MEVSVDSHVCGLVPSTVFCSGSEATSGSVDLGTGGSRK